MFAWISIPCTGGSSWNVFNWNHRPKTRDKIADHVSKFFGYLRTVRKVLRRVREAGVNPIIAMELPASCCYWWEKEVIQFLDGFG